MNKMMEIEVVESFGSYSELGILYLECILFGLVECIWVYLIELEKCVKWFVCGVMFVNVGENFELLFNNQMLGKFGEMFECFKKYENKIMGSMFMCYELLYVLGFIFGIGFDLFEVLFELWLYVKGVLLIIKYWKLIINEGKFNVLVGWYIYFVVFMDLFNECMLVFFWVCFESLESEYWKLILGLS